MIGLVVIALICCLRMTWSWVRPAVSGDALIASPGGNENINFRNQGKWWKRWKVGRELSIATTIGAAKSGSSIALTDWAKQNSRTVSTVKHRKANSISEDLPAAWFLDKAWTRWSTYLVFSSASSTPTIKKGGFYLLPDQRLHPKNCPPWEQRLKNLFPLLCILIPHQAKTRTILSERLIQLRLFIPSQWRMIDIMISLWIRKVKLHTSSDKYKAQSHKIKHSSLGPTLTTSPITP